MGELQCSECGMSPWENHCCTCEPCVVKRQTPLRKRIAELEAEVAELKRCRNDRRHSLSQEIAEGLECRGCWTGNRDYDLITATGKAIDDRDATIERLKGLLRECYLHEETDRCQFCGEHDGYPHKATCPIPAALEEDNDG